MFVLLYIKEYMNHIFSYICSDESSKRRKDIKISIIYTRLVKKKIHMWDLVLRILIIRKLWCIVDQRRIIRVNGHTIEKFGK